jgi:hypothetical protein
MVTLLIIGGIICLLAAFVGSLVALRLQYRFLTGTKVERKAWEQAQEGHQRQWEEQQERHQRQWEEQQEKHIYAAEQKLDAKVEQVQEAWKAWEKKDEQRIIGLNLEYDLARLPYVEDTPVTQADLEAGTDIPANWQPPSFYRADLKGRDFSRRYLRDTNLREANLSDANLYMADLRGACLAGANLQNSNLTGANLQGADLRRANLSSANLLVADIEGAIFYEANLSGTRNLKAEQLYTAHYDHTTIIDPNIDLTVPRLRSIRLKPLPVQETDKPIASRQAHADDAASDETNGPLLSEPSEDFHIETLDTANQNGLKRAKAG